MKGIRILHHPTPNTQLYAERARERVWEGVCNMHGRTLPNRRGQQGAQREWVGGTVEDTPLGSLDWVGWLQLRSVLVVL